jgi:hypothetical protein
MIEVRIPTVGYPEVTAVPLQPLPRSLEGLTLGVIDNQKPNATPLLEAIVQGLSEHGRPKRVIRTQKSPPIPASEEVITTLSGGADMTIIGSAD